MSLANPLKIGIEQLKASKFLTAFGIPAGAGIGVGVGGYIAGKGVSEGLREMGKETPKTATGLIFTVILAVVAVFLGIKVIQAWRRQ